MKDDAISRQMAIEAIRASASKYTGFMEMEMYTDDDAVEAIEGVPPVQSEQKEGWWEEDKQEWPGRYRCSECRRPVWFPENFCPNCGAKMRRKELNEQNFSSD